MCQGLTELVASEMKITWPRSAKWRSAIAHFRVILNSDLGGGPVALPDASHNRCRGPQEAAIGIGASKCSEQVLYAFSADMLSELARTLIKWNTGFNGHGIGASCHIKALIQVA